ncbi:MAG: type IV secretory system conjugative DNA transfer family protein [Trebonia sp.]
MSDWGPSHQQPRAGISDHKKLVGGVLFVAAMASPLVFHLLLWTGLFYGSVRINRRFHVVARLRAFLSGRPDGPPDTTTAVNPSAVYLGVGQAGRSRWARAGRAVLVIGPSQSGKTTSVIVPTLLDYPGPVVSTSTKPDVLRATMDSRLEFGRAWQFDPTGHAHEIPGVQTLRWSPLSCSQNWDGALLMARAMVTGAAVGTGTTDANHWAKRAQALLAAVLHAAAIGDMPLRTVIGWVTSHDTNGPLSRLRDHATVPLALDALTGIANTEARERSSIFSATADALEAYTSQAALDAAEDQNFDAKQFVTSGDTVYIHAPAEGQRMAAPLVCGLLAEIRRATYQAHARGHLDGTVLFALDEVANVAPIAELPQIASEGGGQGLLLLAVLQDLSQARARWGTVADGFLTLFGTKLILPGVADPRTLETISTALGEYDRKVVTESDAKVPGRWTAQRSTSYSTQRTRVLSPGEVANIPAGHALHLDGVQWELVTLTPCFTAGPWRTPASGALR